MRIKRIGIFILICAIFLFIFNSLTFAGTIKGKVTTKKLKIPKDIVVYIEKIEGKVFPPAKEPVIMNQVSLVFVPRVIPIVLGSTVNFKNSDDVLHNVFGVGEAEFDLGTWTGREIRDYTFNKLGEVAILCNVHPEMEAYVLVLQNPYSALTDEQGNYIMKDVPSGTYTLKTWHDSLKSVSKEINISTQEEIVVNF